MRFIFLGSMVLVGLYLLDRLALWAERRGWLYYRNKRSSGGAIGNAFLELQAFFEPSKRHVIEERKKIKSDLQQSGDKPEAG